MTIVESLIWFFTPIILSLIIGAISKRIKGLSVAKLAITGAILGILGVLLAPTILSTSIRDKIIGSLILSSVVNSVLLILATSWFSVDESPP